MMTTMTERVSRETPDLLLAALLDERYDRAAILAEREMTPAERDGYRAR